MKYELLLLIVIKLIQLLLEKIMCVIINIIYIIINSNKKGTP